MTSDKNDSGLMDIQGAAKYLGLSVFTIRGLLRKKELHCYRLGHRILRFKSADLDSWLETQRV